MFPSHQCRSGHIVMTGLLSLALNDEGLREGVCEYALKHKHTQGPERFDVIHSVKERE